MIFALCRWDIQKTNLVKKKLFIKSMATNKDYIFAVILKILVAVFIGIVIGVNIFRSHYSF